MQDFMDGGTCAKILIGCISTCKFRTMPIYNIECTMPLFHAINAHAHILEL